MKYMTNDYIFNEKLGRTGIENNIAMSAFPDLFYIEAIHLSNSIALSIYINSTCSDWINYNQNNNFISNTKNDNSPESEP